MRHAGQPAPDQDKGDPEDAKLLAEDQTERDAQRQGGEQGGQAHALKHHAGIGEGKDRDDEIEHVRRQPMFQRMQRALAPFVGHRNAEGGDHPGQRGMDAGFQHEIPHHRAEQDHRGHPVHPLVVEKQQQRQRDEGREQVVHLEVGGVEQGNDDDGPQVVENGQGEQKDFERRGRAAAHQGENAEREGDVGGRRNGPAGQRCRIAPVDRHIDQGRQRHAADGGGTGQDDVTRVLELAFEDLALQLEPDEKEEDRHQPVVDPEDGRFLEPLTIDHQPEAGVEKAVVDPGKAGIGHDKRRDRREHQENASRCFVAEKTVDGA